MKPTQTTFRFKSVFLLIAVLLGSCTSLVKGTLNESDGGSLVLDITLTQGFQAYWKDLRTADPQIPASPLSQADLGPSFRRLEGVKTWSLENPAAGIYRLKISFEKGQRMSQVISGTSSPIISWTSEGSSRKFTLIWSQETLQSLIRTTGLADASSLEVFLAGGEGELTRDEYIELLSYFLETYDPRAKATVAAASLEMELQFPRVPKSITGGTLSGRTAKFKVPLVDVLLAARPLKWEVVY